ncbi:thiamine pyrophosphate-dependent enzyme [Thermoactinospora rubra]|uniref:thiamine pyrophosphate-dependent enzyme n=1 Tax=Thermoactinospora rubra TaxID=1088767 RepID=UPI003B845326
MSRSLASCALALLWHLPMLFACENNLYGTSTAFVRAQAETHPASPTTWQSGRWTRWWARRVRSQQRARRSTGGTPAPPRNPERFSTQISEPSGRNRRCRWT